MMLEFLFGLFVMILLALAWRRRKKEKQAWIKDERYEESGDWIDKRSGERGTYGSLDEEMEMQRRYIARKSKVNDLAQMVQTKCFEQLEGYGRLDTSVLQRHGAMIKTEMDILLSQAESLQEGGALLLSDMPPAESPAWQNELKKQILEQCYAHYPALLDLEIENLKTLDRAVEQMLRRITSKIVD